MAAFACLSLAAIGTASAAEIAPRDTREPNLISLMNQKREAHGLRKLKFSSKLTTAATRHANSMGKAGYFKHELLHKGSWKLFSTWIGWFWPGPGYGSWSAGENIAWGTPDLGAAKTVRMWMNSPAHRANILGRWGRVGVAMVHVTAPVGYFGAYGHVTLAVADFGRRSG